MRLLPNPHNPAESSSRVNYSSSSPINTQHCQTVFDEVLRLLYPCICAECGHTCSSIIKTRPYVLRCPNCLHQMSKLAHTPFRNLRTPQWMMGWLIEESFIRHPKVVTAAEIQKRLGVSVKAALNLKRRAQLLACEMMPRFKLLIREEMNREFPVGWKLPPNGHDVTFRTRNKKVVHADTMVLFSASERANKGRKRHKKRGLTSSIYMSESLGGEQIGTLVHVMGTRGGWVLLDSVPDMKANTLGPLIRDSLPRNTAIFTDEGYTWLFRVFKNHRMVNHSKKSADKRYRYARDRWCQAGVNNQVAEGINGSLKTAMRSYAWFNPKYSQMYLNEWAFFRNVRYFGIDAIASVDEERNHHRRLWHAFHEEGSSGRAEQREQSERCVDGESEITPRACWSIHTVLHVQVAFQHHPRPPYPIQSIFSTARLSSMNSSAACTPASVPNVVTPVPASSRPARTSCAALPACTRCPNWLIPRFGIFGRPSG